MRAHSAHAELKFGLADRTAPRRLRAVTGGTRSEEPTLDTPTFCASKRPGILLSTRRGDSIKGETPVQGEPKGSIRAWASPCKIRLLPWNLTLILSELPRHPKATTSPQAREVASRRPSTTISSDLNRAFNG